MARTLFFYVTSVVALAACWPRGIPAPRFDLSRNESAAAGSLVPVFQRTFLPRPDGVPELHSPTLVALPGDELLTVYFGGSMEGAPDVKLYQTRFSGGSWLEPTVLLDPDQVGEAQWRHTRRLGNASLFRAADGRLHLFFVSVGIGGWAGSSVNHMVSTDNGHSWSRPERLITSPFFNVSTLVRQPATPLADGGFLLAVYFELTNKFPELLHFDAQGQFVRKVRMDGQHGSLQPCLVPLDDRRAVAYLRNRCLHTGWLLCQHTSDTGYSWTPPSPLQVPNHDAPVSVLRLEPGLFVLAYNPTWPRDKLVLAVSSDGVAWRDIAVLDEKTDPKSEDHYGYCYPTMVQSGDTVDVTYSYRRSAIRHVRFNVAWIKERAGD